MSSVSDQGAGATGSEPTPGRLVRGLRTTALVIAAVLSAHSIFIAYYGQYVDPELIRSTMLFLCAAVVMFQRRDVG